MPLYIDMSGNYDAVQLDLYAITCGDGGYGNTDRVTDADGDTVLPVTYSQTNTGPGPNRLNAIVNTIATSVVVMGVDSTYMLPDGTQVDLVAGETEPPDPNGIIRVYYDTTQCDTSGYYVLDPSADQIILPGPVLLFHELAHAYHEAIGDVLTVVPHSCVGLTPPTLPAEYQAETDENTLRTAFGLPLRDPCSHDGGCGSGDGTTDGCGGGIGTGYGGTSGSSSSGCYIASAAFGSSVAPEVEVLLSLQEVWARQSILGEAFFARFLSEYYAFSPLVAQRMQESEMMRSLLAIIAVEPLLDYFSLIKAAIAVGTTPDTLAQDCEAHLDQFAQRWHDLGFGNEEAMMICDVVQQLGTRLAVQEGTPVRETAPPSAPTDFTPTGLLDFLEQSVLSATTSTVHIRWALLEPLTLYWQALVRRDRGETSGSSAGRSLSEAMPEWLGRAPLPVEFAQMSLNTARTDLQSLSRTFFSLPGARLPFGSRLLTRFAGEVSYDLEQLLCDLDYLPAPAGAERSSEKGGL